MFKFFLLLFYLLTIFAHQSLYSLKTTLELSEYQSKTPPKLKSCDFNQSYTGQTCICKENFTQVIHHQPQDPLTEFSSCQCINNFLFNPYTHSCTCPQSFSYSLQANTCECKGGNILWNQELQQNVCVKNRMWIVFSLAIFVVIVLKGVQFCKASKEKDKKQNYKTLYQRMSGLKETTDDEGELGQIEIELQENILSVKQRLIVDKN